MEEDNNIFEKMWTFSKLMRIIYKSKNSDVVTTVYKLHSTRTFFPFPILFMKLVAMCEAVTLDGTPSVA